MSSPVSILVFGATGFIGGDILWSLFDHVAKDKDASSWSTIAALTSSASKVSDIEAWAKKEFAPEVASKLKVEVAHKFKDNASTFYNSVEEITQQYDVAIQAATSDDLELTKAINRGLETGKKQHGKRGKLLHFSGVQLIESEPVGEYVETPLYDDSKPEQIASIPDSAAHRGIDVEIDNDRLSGKVDSTIVCPALVWGKGRGPGSRVSQQVPDMVRKAIRNGQPVYVGKGTNTWTNVNVNEMTDFIVALLKAQLSSEWSPKAVPWSTFYFAVSEHFHSFKDLAISIGKAADPALLKVSTEPKSLEVPTWDKGQKGVRIEDDARQTGEQAKIENFTPFWPNRTTNRALAKNSQNIPGGPWFKTPFEEKQRIEDVQWIISEWTAKGQLPKYEL